MPAITYAPFALSWVFGRGMVKQQIPPLRYPGFPVELGGVGELHAAFHTESGMTNWRAAAHLGMGGGGWTESTKQELHTYPDRHVRSRSKKLIWTSMALSRPPGGLNLESILIQTLKAVPFDGGQIRILA